MPSPPVPVRCSHQATALASRSGSARLTVTFGGRPEGVRVGVAEPSDALEVPCVIGEGVDLSFTGQDLERSEAEVVDALGGPAVAAVSVHEARCHGVTLVRVFEELFDFGAA